MTLAWSCCSLEELKNRIVVHVIESMEACTHEVACPPGQEYVPLRTGRNEAAKQYPFALDAFQKESICVSIITSQFWFRHILRLARRLLQSKCERDLEIKQCFL